MKFLQPIKVTHALLMMLIGLLLAACSMTGLPPLDIQPPTTVSPTPSETNPLADTAWQLVTTGEADLDTPVTANTTVTLEFGTAGQAGGTAGCNSYGGSYSVNGETIQFSELIVTMMACADLDVMELELRYLEALNTATRFALEDGQLTIWHGEGDARLIFVSADTPTTEIPGTSAQTLSMGGLSLPTAL